MPLPFVLSFRVGEYFTEIFESDPLFAGYLALNWLSITRKWALHSQTDVLLFGNRTNNRIENANGRLKQCTHPRDCLSVSLQKIWRHSGDLLSEYYSLTSYECDRRLVLDLPDHVRCVIDRLTTYASKKVLKHLRDQPEYSVEQLGDTKVTTVHSYCQFRVTNGSRRSLVDVGDGSCNCMFYKTMWLPCCHLFACIRDTPEFTGETVCEMTEY